MWKQQEKGYRKLQSKQKHCFHQTINVISQSLHERRQNGGSSSEKYFEDAKYPKIVRAGKSIVLILIGNVGTIKQNKWKLKIIWFLLWITGNWNKYFDAI